MMELGSGIAVAGLCISGGAVAITAIRTFAKRPNAVIGVSNGFPCKEHSGIVQCLESIEKNQDRQEKWLGEISKDVKKLLEK